MLGCSPYPVQRVPLPSSDKFNQRLQQLQDSLPVALARRFGDSDLMTQAAALTFYALLSLAPLLVLLLWLVASLYPPAQDELLRQLVGLAGPQAGDVAQTVLANAKNQPSVGSLAGLWSTLLLIIGATAVFARLQAALNLIFYTDRKELSGGIKDFLKKRVFSFGVVLGLGFLLIVSMMAATALQVVLNNVPSLLPVLGNALTFALYAAAFGFLYHYLPDRPVEWRQALLGGVITAGLFIAGRYAIGVYLSRTNPGSAYGAMGAMVIMLVWLYYATVVFFIGALITAVIDERMDAHMAHRAAERDAALRQSSTERPQAVDPDANALPAQDLPSHQDSTPRI
ncbi:membrane protein [Pseudoxanthomonas sp. GM95]|nr:membrane protein [Pseudoxanthomonas sp. GM95]